MKHTESTSGSGSHKNIQALKIAGFDDKKAECINKLLLKNRKKDSSQKDNSNLETRIDALDKKIDGLEKRLDSKIDAVESKLEAQIKALDKKIDAVERSLNGVEKRLDGKIDAIESKLITKIDAIEIKLENKMNIQFNNLIMWMVGLTVTMTGIIIGSIKFL